MSTHETSASTRPFASTLLPRPNPSAKPANKRAAPRQGAFTRATVNRLHCPPDQRELFFWDSTCRGFGMRALRSGRRSWVYQYRDEHRRTRRIALGDVSAVPLDAARAAARKHAAGVSQGMNPSVERKAKQTATTIGEIIEAYLRHAKTRQRPRSYEEKERHLERHASPLHREPADALRRAQVTALLERVAAGSGPVAANRVRATLSAMWTWGMRSGLIEADANPVAFTIRHTEKARERTLADAELQAIWQATGDGTDYSCIVRLCMLTGCRREEIGGLRHDEIQAERIVIAAARMKGGLPHEIALLPMISAVLGEARERTGDNVFGRFGTGFSGWSRAKAALDLAIADELHRASAGTITAMPPWNLHDIRRSFSTRLHDAGVEPLVVEALLAHKQQGVAAVYNRASFREAKRAALVQWHGLLEEIAVPSALPVTPVRPSDNAVATSM
jgi:integrase